MRLKATQDWLVTRELKQVPGIIDVTTFGGTTRQYQVIDRSRQVARPSGVTMTQVVNAIQNSNANAGGNYSDVGQPERERALAGSAEESLMT